VRSAIAGGEIKLLQAAKGVGKRAAEQIIVELRDKVGLQATVDAEGVVARSAVDVNDEATQALVALGYSEADAQTALATIDPELNVEQRIKLALKRRT
jgi:Holliday junction DNA helicase RuvA